MLNKVILMGRLTADPEHKQTQSGLSFTRFTIAVQRNFVDKNTGNRESDFISIVAWRQTADFICRFFTKGRMIAIEGSIQTGSYDDKNTGAKRYTTDVIADQVYFADSNPNGNNGNQGAYNNNFPNPQSPPQRPNNNFSDNGGYNNNQPNQNVNYNNNSNQNQNQYQEQQNSNQNFNSNSNNFDNQGAQDNRGFSVGDFIDASDDDDDDFPY